jgi:hypothetical protein
LGTGLRYERFVATYAIDRVVAHAATIFLHGVNKKSNSLAKAVVPKFSQGQAAGRRTVLA